MLHYHLNHLGSTQVITGEDGNLVEEIHYSAYGEIRGQWDEAGNSIDPPEPEHRREFTGYETEGYSGLEYAGARFYDPQMGTFLTHDPMRQFANPYAYGPWDPVNGADSHGEFWFIPAVIAVVSAFVAAHPIITAAVVGGVLGGVNSAVTGQNVFQGIALGVGLGIVGGAAFATGNFAVGIAGGAAVGAAQSAATGQNVLYGALIGAGFGAIGAYSGEIPAVPGQGPGAYAANASVEIGTEAGIGSLRGGFTALANGGDFAKGAAGGAAFGAGFGAAKVGLLGAKTESPFTGKQVQAEFARQSQWDRSGLNLQLPEQGTYNIRVGGIIPSLMRMEAIGTNVAFSSYGGINLEVLAHELRHVAQLQTLGTLPFVGEYATIVPAQARYTLTGHPGQLYGVPGSAALGTRLEPWFAPR